MAPPRESVGGRGRGKGSGGAASGAKGRGSKGGKGRTPERDVVQPVYVAPPKIIEDIWVQCDLCQKWRRLPPETIVDDDAPWNCGLNPDKNKSSCDVPEEDYDASKEVVIASSDPFYKNLIPQDAESLQRELLAKAGLEPPPPLPLPLPAKHASAAGSGAAKQRRGTPDPGGFSSQSLTYGGAASTRKQTKSDASAAKGQRTAQDELGKVAKALQQLLTNMGSWDISTGAQPSSPPGWVWQALAHMAPEVSQEAVYALDALSAARCLYSSQQLLQPPNSEVPSAPTSTDPGTTAQPSHAPAQQVNPGAPMPDLSSDAQGDTQGQGHSATELGGTSQQGALQPAQAAPNPGDMQARAAALTQLEHLARVALVAAAAVALPKIQQALSSGTLAGLPAAGKQGTPGPGGIPPAPRPAAGASAHKQSQQGSQGYGGLQSYVPPGASPLGLPLHMPSTQQLPMQGQGQAGGYGQGVQQPAMGASRQSSGPGAAMLPSHLSQGVGASSSAHLQQQLQHQDWGGGGGVPPALHMHGAATPASQLQQYPLEGFKHLAGNAQLPGLNGLGALNPAVLQLLQQQQQQQQQLATPQQAMVIPGVGPGMLHPGAAQGGMYRTPGGVTQQASLQYSQQQAGLPYQVPSHHQNGHMQEQTPIFPHR